MSAGKGRPRKPTALKVLHGDFEIHPNRRPKNEPQPTVRAPDCPKHLPVLAKHEWRRVVKELAELKVLSIAERSSLEQYCRAYAEWRVAGKSLEDNGRYYVEDGTMKENPAGKAMRAWAVICHKLLCEFGMTPSSRTRLTISDATEADTKEAKYLG
jgi:P27 family predicted phage terminase small subunit